MDIGEFTLNELMLEVLARIENTNGMIFVSSGLARAVVDGIEHCLESGEVGTCVDPYL